MPGYELVGKEELESISKLFHSNLVNLYRYGPNNWAVKDFEEEFAKFLGVKHAHAVSSGTAAIHCALASIGLKPNDEVITTSFTFVAPIEAILAVGAKPIPVEIDETYHICPEAIEKAITPKTKAIVCVPMWHSPKMNKIIELCDKFNLTLIEDAAQCLGGSYNNTKLGTLGKIGSFSFDMGKSMTVGEGGMVVTNDKDLYDIIAEFSDHGHMHLPNLPRGKDPRRSPGLNLRMSELSGAIGLAQIKKLPSILNHQYKNFQYAISKLKNLPITIRPTLENTSGTCDTLIFSLSSIEKTLTTFNKLVEIGVPIKILPEAFDWHFAGSWDHIFTQEKGYPKDLKTQWPKTYDILSRSISIPINHNMSEKDIDNITSKIEQVLT